MPEPTLEAVEGEEAMFEDCKGSKHFFTNKQERSVCSCGLFTVKGIRELRLAAPIWSKPASTADNGPA